VDTDAAQHNRAIGWLRFARYTGGDPMTHDLSSISPEHNQRILRRVIEEGFNKGNYAALDALFTADYQEHQFALHTTLEGFKNDIRALRAGFPDFQLTVDDIIASTDMVWIRMTGRGTNLGPFMGPPTGKSIAITVIDVCRFEDGKIAEHWGVPDRFAVLAQLGLLPKQASESERWR
jgi:predicted ester cyclase